MSEPTPQSYEQAVIEATREQLAGAMAVNAELSVQIRVANQRAEAAEAALADLRASTE
jgi:hypothetical protein